LASPGFGRRFWNPKDPKAYEEQMARSVGPGWLASLPESQWEALKEHESLTDFCHMHLRMNRGLPVDLMRQKFGSSSRLVFDRSRALIAAGWVEFVGGHLRLTREGRLLSNQVFLQLTFSEDELRGLRGLESTLTFHASNPT
jgi:coproporphyrinogen III oxidase-like Fe-S oxidoreductase